MDETLHQFCEQIDAHLGRSTGMEAAVIDYRQNANQASAYDNKGKYMTALTSGIGVHLDRASGVPMIGRGRIERIPARTTRQRRVSSEAVKSHDHALWVASGVDELRLSIKTDQLAARTPHGVTFASVQAAWAAWEQAKEQRALFGRRRDAARDVLHALFSDPGVQECWRGEALETSDGWKLGWSESSRFQAGRCAEVAAQRGIDLEPMKVWVTINHAPTFKLIEPDEFDEVDEIDGQ